MSKIVLCSQQVGEPYHAGFRSDDQGGLSECGRRAPVSFADVSADDYYYEAVLWAVSQGITLGTDDAHFSPDADCSPLASW
ncbi:MAG: S-layer homology domain-containing protein [Dysosmobacter sp.]